MFFFTCIEQSSVGIVEKWGKFSHLAQPGLHFFNPLIGVWLAGSLSLRVQQLDVRCDTKTKVELNLINFPNSFYYMSYSFTTINQDNVFVTVVCSVQYRVVKHNADDAFYELQNAREQIQSYVFDGCSFLRLKENIQKTLIQLQSFHPPSG